MVLTTLMGHRSSTCMVVFIFNDIW